MGGSELIPLAATTYLAVQGREDAHHQEQVAKNEMKKSLAAAPKVQKAPDIAARDAIRKRKQANAYGRADTILTGTTTGGPTEYSAPKTLLGS